MSQVDHQLVQLAQAAVCHAWEEHQLVLDPQHVDRADQVLDRERTYGSADQRHAIQLCYGAWLGEWAVSHVGGRWIGLSESTPPRIAVNGVICSPIDAVERRLLSEQSPPLRELVQQWIDWSDKPHEDLSSLKDCRQAWDARCTDSRFIQSESLPTDRDAILASLDPWLRDEGSLEGRRVLCLAAGGGRHGPLLALAGSQVTVIDLSPRQLDIDRELAIQYGLSIRTIETSMDSLSMLDDASFDLVIQPVSSCYSRHIVPLYREVARLLRSGGLYLSQHKQPTALQGDAAFAANGYAIRFPYEEGRALPPTSRGPSIREGEMTEFLHTWEGLVGELCRAGFAVEDLQEPPRGDAWAPVESSEHRARFLPPYVKIKARRIATERRNGSF